MTSRTSRPDGIGFGLRTTYLAHALERVTIHYYVYGAGKYKGATNRLVNELQWDAILPCHGNYIPSGGKQILKQHLGLK